MASLARAGGGGGGGASAGPEDRYDITPGARFFFLWRKTMAKDKDIFKVTGKALLLSSFSFAAGSVVMSSRWSVQNFSTDQKTLDRARDALLEYTYVAALWCVGCSMLLYASYGSTGLALSLACNFSIWLWIWTSYVRAFKEAAQEHGLRAPDLLPRWLGGRACTA